MSETKFTWIPFYKELAQKILEYKDKRSELMNIVYSLLSNYTKYLQWKPEDGSGVDNPEIDPFSIFSIFNRGLTVVNRKEILSHFKKELKINAAIPEDFEGIPIMNNMNSFFRSKNSSDYSHELFDTFWNLFESVVTNSRDFSVYFDEIISLKK
ncbi:MAG: hypothetical protein J6I73_02865 [Treponema sp.]|nr:hypothetical protein [Treponema sp.]